MNRTGQRGPPLPVGMAEIATVRRRVGKPRQAAAGFSHPARRPFQALVLFVFLPVFAHFAVHQVGDRQGSQSCDHFKEVACEGDRLHCLPILIEPSNADTRQSSSTWKPQVSRLHPAFSFCLRWTVLEPHRRALWEIPDRCIHGVFSVSRTLHRTQVMVMQGSLSTRYALERRR